MIYIGKVTPPKLREEANRKVIDFLAKYEPQKISVPSDEEKQKNIKTRLLHGFISGEMSDLMRKNENLLTRDCLILDLDDIIVAVDVLKVEINRLFSGFDYALFPSVSNGLKGVRYRLVLPLDKSVQREEYSLIVRFFNERILKGIIGVPDESNVTWSQIQLLPVVTQFNRKEDILINQTGKQLPTDALLAGARTFFKGKPVSSNAKETNFTGYNKFKKGSSRYRNTTTELFESLVLGCKEGNRNNRIAQITGGLLARSVNVKVVYALVLFANEHFEKPLPVEEVEKTFYSIAKKELGID